MSGRETATHVHPTVQSALRAATARLASTGVERAGDDARRLLSGALGLSAAQLLALPERNLSAAEDARFAHMLDRRAWREPVSRILGERAFYGRDFVLSPATLDPRPDSETLIDVVLGMVGSQGLGAHPIRILDVGTGTGCLLITLLCELPEATGVGTDISPDALATARTNAQRLGVADRASWREANALDGIDEPFDLLVCNPPYIRSADIAALEPEVRDFDPRQALDGGCDGLEIFRRMAPRVTAVVPNGWALFEVGFDQAKAVADLLCYSEAAANPAQFTLHKDVAGMSRCVAWKTRA